MLAGKSNNLDILGVTIAAGNVENQQCTQNALDVLHLIERDDKKEIEIYLREKFKNLKNIKNVVLGCTHYPLIKKEISSILGDIKFFDSAYGVTKQLKKKIEELDIKEEKQKIYFYDSNNNKEKENRFYKIIEKEKV